MFLRLSIPSPQSLFVFALLSTLLATPLLAGGDWAGYRGPAGDGIANAPGLVTSLDAPALEVGWHKSIGSGYSGIAVVGDHLVTLFAEGEHDVVAAFSAADGKELWRRMVGPTYPGHDGSHDGPISTPLIADGRVFVLGPWGDLLAVSLESGEEIWRQHLVKEQEIAKPHYGFGTSPLLAAGVVVVELGGEGTAVAGLDPATGERRWTVGDDGVSYQTPVPWSFEGKEQIVAVGNEKLLGIDPADGSLLWEFPHGGGGGRGMASLTPVPAGEGRLFLAHQNDGSIMVELKRENGELKMVTLWEGRTIRNSYTVPVYHEGHLYAYSARILTCVDATTGEARWRSREPGDGFLTLVDGHLVVTAKKGGVFLVEATAEAYREVAGTEVFGDFAWTAPSIAGGAIYTRGLDGLARIDLASGGSAMAGTSGGAGDSAFARFVATVEAAGADEKQTLVERFLAEQKSFPVTEGQLAHFVYRGEAQDVAVGGDMFGARREEPMHRIDGTDVFYRSVELAPAARVQYLFQVDFEMVQDPLNERQVDFSFIGPDMEMAPFGGGLAMSWFGMPGWAAPAHLAEAPEARRGILESHSLESEKIEGEAKVELQVYLPKGYAGEGDARYPVAFVHGGSSAISEGLVPNSLDHLMGESMAQAIVVFVSIPARGPDYEEIFLGEVLPLIDEGYATRAEASARANIGAGFSAPQALMMTLDHPDLFGKAGLQSPFLFSQLRTMVDERLSAERTGEAPQIYLDWGSYDLRNPHEAWDMADEGRALDANLRAAGFEPMGGEAVDGTGWASWRNRTDALYGNLFPLAGD